MTTSQGKKAQKCNISHMWGEAPVKDNATKFGTGVDIHNVITHAKFKVCKFDGLGFTGVEFWPSRLTLHMGLNTVLRNRTACDCYIVVAKYKGPPSKTLLLMRQKRQPVR